MLTGAMIPAIFFWQFVAFTLLCIITRDWYSVSMSALITSLLLLVNLLWFLAVVGLYSLMLKLLWSNPPRWLRLPRFKVLVLRDFTTAIVATIPLTILYSFVIAAISFSNRNDIFYDIRDFEDGEFLLGNSWLWVVTAAALYGWAEQRWPRRKVEK